MALRNEDLTSETLGAAFQAHRRPLPGLLESVYCAALAIELRRRQLRFARAVRLGGFPVGLLLHFNVPSLKHGTIRRVL